MSSFKNILFPFDSKIRSDESFIYAINLARKHRSNLIFLHTIRLNSANKLLTPMAIKKRMKDTSGKRLEEIRQSFNLDNLANYEFHTEIGFLASRVILKIKEFPIDLLVIEKDLMEEFNGNAQDISCPIMIIPYQNDSLTKI